MSTDGGATYVDRPLRGGSSRASRTVTSRGRTDGRLFASNIVHNERDGFYYALVYVNLRDTYIGNCLIRTKDLADQGRGERGAAAPRSLSRSSIRTVKPCSRGASLRAGATAQPGDLQPNSLTYSTAARQWLLVGQAVGGAYFSLSPDLLHWTAPKLFFAAQVTWNYQCGDPDPIAYPSVIDPKARPATSRPSAERRTCTSRSSTTPTVSRRSIAISFGYRFRSHRVEADACEVTRRLVESAAPQELPLAD